MPVVQRSGTTDSIAVVVVLSFNSVGTIEATVRAAQLVSRSVLVVDSFSTDGTPDLVRQLGCEVVQRTFRDYADQRNWAIKRAAAASEWQVHLDADEVLENEAANEIRQAIADSAGCCGFLLRRRTYFMGRRLRFGGGTSWHLRVFRSELAHCEDRLYDQHFVCAGQTRRLRGWMNDMNVGSLSELVVRHNRWSSMEAEELRRVRTERREQVVSRLSGDPRERRRLYKGVYYRAPILVRPVLYFLYRYFLQLGFLDGRAGFLYAFFQVLWFRMLVDAKLLERAKNVTP